MITKNNQFVNKNIGSSFDITRARVGGASVIPLLSYFLISVPPSRRKVLGAKPKQAGKKEGGWGEGIFARLLPFPFRLSKGKAEGGFGGNSAFLLLNQNEASPATLQFIARHHRKILFSLREKEMDSTSSPQVRRAPCLPAGRQNEKSKEYFSVVWRACRAVAGVPARQSFSVGGASLVWFRSTVSDKKGSRIFKQRALIIFLWMTNMILRF